MFEQNQHKDFDGGELPIQGTDQQSTLSHWRLKLVKFAFLLAFVGIIVRLVQIQIFESPKYREIAQRQYEAKVILPAVRGNIYDRNGNVLASNTMFVSFAADPKAVGGNGWKVAERFSQIFGKPRKYYLEKLESSKRFVWLERQVRPELAKRLQNQTLPGIVEFNEPKRLYHYHEIGGALTGFTDVDNLGLNGIEWQFDEQLRGTNGYVILQRDGRGQARPSVDYLRAEPVNGSNIFLTVDLVYQSIAEDKLKKGVERTHADGGLVVMMVPSTGEILAIAQYPPLDPSFPALTQVEHQKLRAVTDMFEPGSVFKVVTASAALEDHLVRPNQQFNAEHGTYTVRLPNGQFRIIKDTHEYDVLTFQQAMEVSSNIVMAKVSELIGAERLYTKARAFGFGSETGIEFPGEAKGDLKRPIHWSGTTLNTLAYGYEIGATPLQIVAAYSTVANGGVLMKPTLVKKIVDASGIVVEDRKPEPVRRVISSDLAALLTSFFEGVIERGTGKPAKIDGIRMAGKTGTSRKYVGGKYRTGIYTASFVGYFPIEQPEVVCLVMLDNPRIGGYTGGTAVAPIFKEIAQRIIATGKAIIPNVPINLIVVHASENDLTIPDVTSLQLDVAKKVLESRGLFAETFGEGIVVRQIPAPGVVVERGSRVTLVLNGTIRNDSNTEVVVPDLRGLSVRRAVNRLAADKLEARIHGSGIVIDQMPQAGTTVPVGASILLVCEPQAFAQRTN